MLLIESLCCVGVQVDQVGVLSLWVYDAWKVKWTATLAPCNTYTLLYLEHLFHAIQVVGIRKINP